MSARAAGGIAGNKTLILHWDGTSWTQLASPSPGTEIDQLNGVTGTSAAAAWAVGDYAGSSGRDQTLILRWNGTSWKKVTSPDVTGKGDDNIRYGVAATATGNAWAVGAATITSTGTAFELHWNGTRWANMTSPNPGATSAMYAVSATSASDAVTAGEFSDDSAGQAQRNLAFFCT